MINISICDDERDQIKYLTSVVSKWALLRDASVRISDYTSAESFLFNYEDDKSADILLLDIQMGGMDGVELARTIRRENSTVQIVFITGFPDFIAEGYDVSALHYLMKPIREDKLFEVLDRAALGLRRVPRMIVFPKVGGDIKINADDIIYAEVISHTVTLNLAHGTEEFNMRISDMEKLLGEGFFKCHRSYIVSMKFVRRVTKSAMILSGGQEIPLSRNLYDAANQAFIECN
ncbi:MAG: LytTR family DNA-binding domain-containing protein [Oscillospiraceae bacterium]|jgi:DNA-binding LytR/AlgR family response regulator|nr:LytTR family DNA-binding domain-containing protein [Oscillospiraceae bacterium]